MLSVHLALDLYKPIAWEHLDRRSVHTHNVGGVTVVVERYDLVHYISHQLPNNNAVRLALAFAAQLYFAFEIL